MKTTNLILLLIAAVLVLGLVATLLLPSEFIQQSFFKLIPDDDLIPETDEKISSITKDPNINNDAAIDQETESEKEVLFAENTNCQKPEESRYNDPESYDSECVPPVYNDDFCDVTCTLESGDAEAEEMLPLIWAAITLGDTGYASDRIHMNDDLFWQIMTFYTRRMLDTGVAFMDEGSMVLPKDAFISAADALNLCEHDGYHLPAETHYYACGDMNDVKWDPEEENFYFQAGDTGADWCEIQWFEEYGDGTAELQVYHYLDGTKTLYLVTLEPNPCWYGYSYRIGDILET